MEFKNLSIRKIYDLIRNCVHDGVAFRFDIYEKPNFYLLNLYVGGKIFFHIFDGSKYDEYCKLYKYAAKYEKL